MNATCAATTTEAGDWVRQVGQGLLDRSLPHRQWTHEAHLAAALYLAMARPDLEPSLIMPGLIRRYNETNGVANTDHSGFHATITELYVRAIAHFVTWLPRNTTLGSAMECLLATPIADRKFPLCFYSRERLMSVAARRAWMAPDLQPLSGLIFLAARPKC